MSDTITTNQGVTTMNEATNTTGELSSPTPAVPDLVSLAASTFSAYLSQEIHRIFAAAIAPRIEAMVEAHLTKVAENLSTVTLISDALKDEIHDMIVEKIEAHENEYEHHSEYGLADTIRSVVDDRMGDTHFVTRDDVQDMIDSEIESSAESAAESAVENMVPDVVEEKIDEVLDEKLDAALEDRLNAALEAYSNEKVPSIVRHMVGSATIKLGEY